jgi:hypothetical protein
VSSRLAVLHSEILSQKIWKDGWEGGKEKKNIEKNFEKKFKLSIMFP